MAGFLALHDEPTRALCDQRLFIDLPEEEIMRRRTERADPNSPWDTPEYINEELIPGHRQYVEPQREYADHIVDGMLDPDQLAYEVARLITELRSAPKRQVTQPVIRLRFRLLERDLFWLACVPS